MILKRAISDGRRILLFRLSLRIFCKSFFAVLACLQLVTCTTSSSLYEKTESEFSGKNLFPEKVKVTHAKGFLIDYHNHYKVLKILSPFEKSTDTMSYLLLQRGTPRPKGYPEIPVIEIPVRSLVVMSSLHIGLVGFLEAEDILTGMGNLKYVSSPKVLERIKTGKVAEVGKDQGINEELLVLMHPDLVMTTGSPVSKINRYQSLSEAGVPVLINSEWIETTPLGRAEWVKLLAALLNKEAVSIKNSKRLRKNITVLRMLRKKQLQNPA